MKKYVVMLIISLLIASMSGCGKSDKDINIIENGTETATKQTISISTIKEDINLSNHMPINLCYDGFIIYLSNEGTGNNAIYTYEGEEIMPFGEYSISPIVNSYVKVYSNKAIDGTYPMGIFNVKTKSWLFAPSVKLNNGSTSVTEYNNHLKVVVDGEIEYYNDSGEKIDKSTVDSSIISNVPDYFNADWVADSINKNYYAVVNEKHGIVTEYDYRNVRSFDGGFYRGIAFFTDEIKPGVDRQGIISALGEILVEPQYSELYVANDYVLGIKTSTTADLYKIEIPSH